MFPSSHIPKFWTVNKYEVFLYLVKSLHQYKTTALSSSESVMPRFHLIFDLLDMNAPITETVYMITSCVRMDFGNSDEVKETNSIMLFHILVQIILGLWLTAWPFLDIGQLHMLLLNPIW